MTVDQLADRRMERLVQELTILLREHETIVVEAAQVDDIDTWRKAVRIAGRGLGVPGSYRCVA